LLTNALYGTPTDAHRMRSLRDLLLAINANQRDRQFGSRPYDYIILDLSPSADIINQNALMLSDYWILPSTFDNYCMITFQNLARWAVYWMEMHTYVNGYKPNRVRLVSIIMSRFSSQLKRKKNDNNNADNDDFNDGDDDLIDNPKNVGLPTMAKYFQNYAQAIEPHKERFLQELRQHGMITDASADPPLYKEFQIQEYKFLMSAFNQCNVAAHKLTNADLNRNDIGASLGNDYKRHQKQLTIILQSLYELLESLPDMQA